MREQMLWKGSTDAIQSLELPEAEYRKEEDLSKTSYLRQETLRWVATPKPTMQIYPPSRKGCHGHM